MKQKIYLFIVFAVFALGIMTLAGCHHKQKQEEQQAIESRKKPRIDLRINSRIDLRIKTAKEIPESQKEKGQT